MKYFYALLYAALCAWLIGCTYVHPVKPAPEKTPRISASITDTETKASAQIGAIGEVDFVATHARTVDGLTTGTVTVKVTKNTEQNIIMAFIGFLTGLFVHAGGA